MKKIAILGASEPHLPLFLKAKEMGLETYCFAWSQGAYCKTMQIIIMIYLLLIKNRLQ